MTPRLHAWGPPFVWAAVIFVASAQHGTGIDLSGGLDKVAHFGVYAVLGLLLARAWPGFAGALLLGCLYGLSDELHQMWVPGRSAEVADWVADALGVLAGIFIYRRATRSAASSDS